MKSRVTTWLFIIVAVAVHQAAADDIYNLDFTAPETGNYQTNFGQPAIQATVGPFEDAMVFRAVTGYEQIRLNVGNVARRYDIQYDVLVHNLLNSEYAFSIHLDHDLNLSQFQTVYFHGGLNSIDTFSTSPFGPGILGGFSNDQVYHFGIALDSDAMQWSLDIGGTRRFTSGLDGLNLESIRFTMAPRIGGAVDDPTAYAAIDNVVVRGIPEPSTSALIALGGLVVMVFLRNKRGNRF